VSWLSAASRCVFSCGFGAVQAMVESEEMFGSTFPLIGS
jgi:hypothetical protein